ncbi:MAG: 50S ribosomal protein L29 [Acidimicrobiales bacterium]
MTTAAEYRDLDESELQTRLENARKELFNLRFQSATGRLDNPARVGVVRKEIARVLTVQREREIEEAEAAEATGRRGEEA